ncbi:MAG: hypothetical protein ACOC3J_07660 [Gemmatimonadota bacterium]
MSRLSITDPRSIANLMPENAGPRLRWVRRLEIALRGQDGSGLQLRIELRPALSDDPVDPASHGREAEPTGDPSGP